MTGYDTIKFFVATYVEYDYDTYCEVMDDALRTMNELLDEVDK